MDSVREEPFFRYLSITFVLELAVMWGHSRKVYCWKPLKKEPYPETNCQMGQLFFVLKSHKLISYINRIAGQFSLSFIYQ